MDENEKKKLTEILLGQLGSLDYSERKIATSLPETKFIGTELKKITKNTRRFRLLAILFGIAALIYVGVLIWQFGKPPGAFSKINLIVQSAFMAVFTLTWVIMYHLNKRKKMIFAILEKIQKNF